MHPVLRAAVAVVGSRVLTSPRAAHLAGDRRVPDGHRAAPAVALDPHRRRRPDDGAVVRPDGWLVAATGWRYNGTQMVGGGLVLVPPWGGKAIPFGDPPDRGTRSFGFTSLVQRGDRLFGLTSVGYAQSTVVTTAIPHFTIRRFCDLVPVRILDRFAFPG